MSDWDWDTPTAHRIADAVTAARDTPTYRWAVRTLRTAGAVYVLAILAMCLPLGHDRTVAVVAGLVILAGVAVPLTVAGNILARRANWSSRPADVDGRRHWAAEVSVTLDRDTLSLSPWGGDQDERERG